MKKIIFLLGFLFSSLQAEYIIFINKNGPAMPITDETEYAKAYDILTTYQWPSIIGMAHKLPIKEVLEISRQGQPSEELFLRKKLKEINPGYDLMFIPTALYELFVLQVLGTNHNIRSKQLHPIFAPEKLSTLLADKNTSLDTILAHYSYVNERKKNETETSLYITMKANICSFHQIINNDLLQNICNGKSGSLQELYQIALPQLVAHASQNYEQLPLLKIMEMETKAHMNNTALLYRGGRYQTTYIPRRNQQTSNFPIEHVFARGNNQNKKSDFDITNAYSTLPWAINTHQADKIFNAILPSVSYGTSLFAGRIYDGISGCAYAIITSDNTLGYTLSINKRNYLLGNLRTLFFISAYNTLISLFARGEFFHARSISYCTSAIAQYFKTHDVKWFICGNTESFCDAVGCFVKVGNPLQKSYELSKYISENAQIFKMPKEHGSFSFSALAPQYLTATQIEFTKFLRALMTIKKCLRKKYTTKSIIGFL